MVSNTKQTMTQRARRQKRMNRRRKRLMAKKGTPTFPIHPEGYDPKAADARGPDSEAKA
jgi:hypothetical protein